MDRHLLIAVSGQKSALHGVRFVSHFFGDKSSIKATFFYSAPEPPKIWDGEKSLEALQRQKAQERKLLADGKTALETAVTESTGLGFPRENLFEKLQNRQFTTVADIVTEGEKGSYDAVVLGRRGMSMLEEAFEESVSRKLFEEPLAFPLWLCPSSAPDRRHLLFYADGSPTSFAMADHLGFVSGLENRHRVDIIATEAVAGEASLKDRYQKILLNHGIPHEGISWIEPPKGDLADAILRRVDDQHYAAVALGRSAPGRSVLARLFKGPVCSRLFRELKDAALWICH